MVDQNTNQNVWLAAALVLVVLVAGLFIVGGANVSEDEVKDLVAIEMAKLNVPSAQEIADLIVVPVAEVPEIEVPIFESDNKVDDLWKDLYSAEIAKLELEAEDAATFELEDEEYGLLVEFLEANIEGFDELEDVDFEVEDIEVKVLNLGLEEEDKVAEVVFELEIEYTLESGVVQDYKDDVIATANVVFEYDEEEPFEDVDVDLVFAF